MLMNEIELKIRLYGDPVLRRKSLPVKVLSDQERRLFDDMLKIMHKSGGIGLAAPQLGINKQIIVAEIEGHILKIANPKILRKVGQDIFEEGCLSIPDVSIKIKRASQINVEGLNEFGQRTELKLGGLLARVVQHEIDHLLGRLIIDYVGIHKRLFLRNKLNQIKARYNGKMQQSERKSCQLSL